MVERVELHTLAGVKRQRAWSTGNPSSSRYRRVEVGTLADGRHFAWHTGKRGGAYVFGDERAACELADRWLATGEWTPTPARFDAQGHPADQGA